MRATCPHVAIPLFLLDIFLMNLGHVGMQILGALIDFAIRGPFAKLAGPCGREECYLVPTFVVALHVSEPL